MRRLNWNNIPIPEGHVVLLLAGLALHWWLPLRLFDVAWLGWLLLTGGILLAGWAVAAAGEVDTRAPAHIIETGPFAFTRNPMYLAWTVIYLAAALLANTWWLIILLPVVVLFTHYFVVLKEERQLEARFGEPYRRYRARVRRYL